LGAEGDSNVTRVERGPGEPAAVAATLVRGLVGLGKTGTLGEHLRWSGHAKAGVREVVAGSVESENIVTGAGELAVERDGPSGTTILARASHYDALALDGGPERRDFATSGVDVGLRLPADDAREAEVEVGLRTLTWRRDHDFDWSGPLLALELRDQVWRCHDERALDLTARYQVELREYTGLAFTRVSCTGDPSGVCVRPTGEQRADLRHTAEAELLYTGNQVLSARYRLTVNDSSSFGSSLYRHRLDLAATFSLPGQLFVTATLTGQLDHFPEPFLAHIDDLNQPVDSIDDENRSGVAVRVARALSKHWQVEARGAAFTDLFPRDGHGFGRQLGYLGLEWERGGD
ncbi:MAG TPA: hypothetical protein VHE35_16155, partial [Kofleriaceae bacterium]|nr:hypothetical protein [Kofleriaceae bacterium]